MKNTWTLTPKSLKVRSKKGYFYDIIQKDGLTLMHCVTGAISQSFSTSKGFKDVSKLDISAFEKAYEESCFEFRKNYRETRGEEYEQGNETILSNYAQVYIDRHGEISAFVHGESLVGLYRAGQLIDLKSSSIQAQSGDIVYLNIEGAAVIQKQIQRGEFEFENGTYSALSFVLERDAIPVVVDESAPVSKEVVVGKNEVVTSAKSTEIAINRLTEPEVLKQKPNTTGKIASIMIGLGLLVAGGFGFSKYYPTLVPVEDSTIVMPIDSTAEILSSPSQDTTPELTYATSDSIWQAYLDSTPRQLVLLEMAIDALEEEAQDNPDSAAPRRQKYTQERQDLLKQLKNDFDLILGEAQIAIEEGRYDDAEKTFAQAQQYLSDNFGDLVDTEVASKMMTQELSKRRRNLEELRRESF
jgi:tetratricopeptide (TPR) repeat protein